MSGYFGQLAARALGEPARLAPPPRLRFGEAIDPGLTAPPVAEERPAVTKPPQPARVPAAPPPVVSRESDVPARAAIAPVQQPPAQRDEAQPQIDVPPLPDPPPARPPAMAARPEPTEPKARQVEPRPLPPERRPTPPPPTTAVVQQPLAPDVHPAPPTVPPISVVVEPPQAAVLPPPPPLAAIPLAPARAPEPAAQLAQAYERPRVTISIGQIELRAANDKPTPPPRPAPPVRERPRKPGLPLDDYLEQRSRR